MRLVEADPLAHRALDGLLREAGGEMELRALRLRLGTSKASATEVVNTLVTRGLATRARLSSDRRAVAVTATAQGSEVVDRLYPEHAGRVAATFAALDDVEKRQLARICLKLAA